MTVNTYRNPQKKPPARAQLVRRTADSLLTQIALQSGVPIALEPWEDQDKEDQSFLIQQAYDEAERIVAITYGYPQR